MASYNYPQFADKRWKTPVATVAALPVLGSVAGDARITLDTFAVYVFNGTTWTSIAGTGDVVGPASSVNNALVQFSGVTGKLLKNLALGTANQVLGMTNAATDQEYKTLSVGTTGTDFAIVHAANSVAFNLPDASATARGVITTGVQTIAGVKTFSSTITGSISGNAATVTTNANLTGVVTSVGNATSFATSPTFTGTVTIPTPFTIGAVSMTATGTQLNYLNAATGTTGTTSTNLVFSASPTFTGTVTIPTPFTLGATSVTTTGTQLNYLNAATGTTGTTSTNVVFSTSPTLVTPVLGVASATSLTASSNVLAGSASAIAVTVTENLVSPLQSILNGSVKGGLFLTNFNASGFSPRATYFYPHNATIGTTYGACPSGYELGRLDWWAAYDTANKAEGARITCESTTTWSGASVHGAKLVFSTAPNSGASILTALTLGQDQSATFTGQIQAPAGSGSAPSHSFSGDPDTGVTSGGANTLALVTAGTNALYILSNGQIQNAISGNETTGGGTALLGTNSPAVTNTAPYRWLKITTSDGSQGYIPVWK